MAQLVINIPDAVAQRVVNNLCAANGIDPPTAAAARQVVINFIRQTVIDWDNQKNNLAAVIAVPPAVDPGLT